MSAWITDELLDSLRRVESGGNRFAVSKAGAKGPYQFMDATAKELGLSDPFDEVQSRGAAKRYLNQLDRQFGNPKDALTAYNWGMGNVAKMLRTGGTNMPTEARQYAGKVLGNKMDYFEQPDIDPRIAAAMLRKQQGAPMPAMQGMQPPDMGDPSQLMARFSTAPDPMQQQQYAFQQPQGRDIAGLRQRSDDAFTQGMTRLNEEPDIAKYQELAKKRSAEGGQHLMLALAAQQAGKEFEPIGGMYLKQAMAARDPMQVGKAGMITGEGEFIADPFYQREKQADMLLKRSDYFAKLAETAQTQQERVQAAEQARQDRLRSDELMRGQRQQGLDIQKQGIDQRAEDQRRNDQERRERQAATDTQRKTEGDVRRVDGVRREYTARLQKVQEAAGFADSVTQMIAMPDLAKNAPAQIALVMQFGKMLDPDSVVREEEQRMIMKARGLFDSWGMTPERIQSGAFLTPKQISQMQQIANQLRGNNGQRLNDLKTYYADFAKRNGLPVEDIVQGYSSSGGAIPPNAVRERQPMPTQQPNAPSGPPPGAVRERTR